MEINITIKSDRDKEFTAEMLAKMFVGWVEDLENVDDVSKLGTWGKHGADVHLEMNVDG